MSKTTLTFRARSSLRRRLQGYADDLDAHAQTKLTASDVIRDAANFEVGLWGKAPYVALRNRVTLWVTAAGQFVYLREEHLRINHDIRELAFEMQMKHERVEALMQQPPPGRLDLAQWLRSRWRSVRFQVRRPDGTLLHTMVNPPGITNLSWRAPVNTVSGRELIREHWAVIDDYAQTSAVRGPTDPILYDSVNYDVVLPSMNVEVRVLVDEAGYDHPLRLSYQLQAQDGSNLDHAGLPESDGDRLRDNVELPAPAAGASDGQSVAQEILDCLCAVAHACGVGPDLQPPTRAAVFKVTLPRARMGLRVRVQWPCIERRAD